MQFLSSFEDADQRRRWVDVHGAKYLLREYVGAAPTRGTYVEGNEVNDNELPQGFLVNQPPGSVTPPHFHETNQFQVFVGGSGRMGKKPAGPVTVQFAGGHTPYGPIVASDDGVQYFTLRQRWDPGAKYMPQMREKLARGHQRQRLAAPLAATLLDAVQTLAQPSLSELIRPEPDGLAAYLLRLGPGQQVSGPAGDMAGGQYHVVLCGTLMHGGEELARLGCRFASPEEGAVSFEAGGEGLAALVLQFPRWRPPPSDSRSTRRKIET